jgi:hypothetical protein
LRGIAPRCTVSQWIQRPVSPCRFPPPRLVEDR